MMSFSSTSNHLMNRSNSNNSSISSINSINSNSISTSSTSFAPHWDNSSTILHHHHHQQPHHLLHQQQQQQQQSYHHHTLNNVNNINNNSTTTNDYRQKIIHQQQQYGTSSQSFVSYQKQTTSPSLGGGGSSIVGHHHMYQSELKDESTTDRILNGVHNIHLGNGNNNSNNDFVDRLSSILGDNNDILLNGNQQPYHHQNPQQQSPFLSANGTTTLGKSGIGIPTSLSSSNNSVNNQQQQQQPQQSPSLGLNLRPLSPSNFSQLFSISMPSSATSSTNISNDFMMDKFSVSSFDPFTNTINNNTTSNQFFHQQQSQQQQNGLSLSQSKIQTNQRPSTPGLLGLTSPTLQQEHISLNTSGNSFNNSINSMSSPILGQSSLRFSQQNIQQQQQILQQQQQLLLQQQQQQQRQEEQHQQLLLQQQRQEEQQQLLLQQQQQQQLLHQQQLQHQQQQLQHQQEHTHQQQQQQTSNNTQTQVQPLPSPQIIPTVEIDEENFPSLNSAAVVKKANLTISSDKISNSKAEAAKRKKQDNANIDRGTIPAANNVNNKSIEVVQEKVKLSWHEFQSLSSTSNTTSESAQQGVDEQASRVLWVGNIGPYVTEEELKSEFSVYGELESVRILHDRFCAFVNFKDTLHASIAKKNMHNQVIGSQFIVVNFRHVNNTKQDDSSNSSNSNSNTVNNNNHSPSTTSANNTNNTTTNGINTTTDSTTNTTTTTNHTLSRAIYIGNVSDNLTEKDIRKECEKYGDIESVRVLRKKACAFVNFISVSTATAALQALNGKRFGDTIVRVNYGKPQPHLSDTNGSSQHSNKHGIN